MAQSAGNGGDEASGGSEATGGAGGNAAAGAAGGGAAGTSGSGGEDGASGSAAGSGGSDAEAGAGGDTAGAGAGADAGPCNPALDDCCPSDPLKIDPGVCGCGTADTDSDDDGSANCLDAAPFGWQRSLTLDGTQVTATLASFVLLVRLTDAHLQANAAASGADIYFTAVDQTSLLDYEVESYDAATGSLVAWVRVPSLTASTDTLLFLGYADGKSNRSNSAGVWSGHHNVWHLGQDPGAGNGAIKDATQRAHGTAQGAMAANALVPGVAGQGLSFDGVDDQIAFTNDVSGSGPSTLSAWVKQAADSGDYGSGVVALGNDASGQARFILSAADSAKVKCGFYSNDDLTNVVLPTAVWKYLVWTWDGSKTSVYIDGVSVQGPTTHSGVNTSGSDGKIGNGTFTYSYLMSGQLDEVRVATIARSNAWIAAEYANQRPGSTFIESVGAAQAALAH